MRIGDLIKIQTVAHHIGADVWRVVNGFRCDNPTVRYQGWPKFMVRADDIVEHIPQG